MRYRQIHQLWEGSGKLKAIPELAQCVISMRKSIRVFGFIRVRLLTESDELRIYLFAKIGK